MRACTVDSPIGPLSLYADGQVLRGVHMEDPRFGSPVAAVERAATGILAEAAEQLGAYFAGCLRAFDLACEPEGTPFQREVWHALAEVPFGATVTYGELAAAAGRPGAARAIGNAMARNPIAVVVPCHRVVGASGALTGFGGGLDRKRFLLDHEHAVVAGSASSPEH